MNEHANFATFGTAMQTLVRVATGEFWNGLMHDYMDDGYPIALVFFFTFVVLVTFIMLNLIIGVLIINFLESSDEGAVQMDDIVDYRKAWAVLDPDDTGSIDVNDLPNLMKALDMPLGLHRPTEYAVLKHIPQIVLRQAISQVRNILPVVEGRVNIVETLFVLAWRQQEIEEKLNVKDDIEQEENNLKTQPQTMGRDSWAEVAQSKKEDGEKQDAEVEEGTVFATEYHKFTIHPTRPDLLRRRLTVEDEQASKWLSARRSLRQYRRRYSIHSLANDLQVGNVSEMQMALGVDEARASGIVRNLRAIGMTTVKRDPSVPIPPDGQRSARAPAPHCAGRVMKLESNSECTYEESSEFGKVNLRSPPPVRVGDDTELARQEKARLLRVLGENAEATIRRADEEEAASIMKASPRRARLMTTRPPQLNDEDEDGDGDGDEDENEDEDEDEEAGAGAGEGENTVARVANRSVPKRQCVRDGGNEWKNEVVVIGKGPRGRKRTGTTPGRKVCPLGCCQPKFVSFCACLPRGA